MDGSAVRSGRCRCVSGVLRIGRIVLVFNQLIFTIMKEEKKSVFAVLNAINVNEHTEKKNNLTYLSWAWAWSKVKENYPEAFYTIYENKDGMNYHTDGRTCWVKTGVTIEGIEHIEYLPVMDYKNASIPLERVTSFDVNKAIQRSLTKAAARHGLGLYIYAGEDLPEEEKEKATDELGNACLAAAAAADIRELESIYHKYEKKYMKDNRVLSAVNKRKNELQNAA